MMNGIPRPTGRRGLGTAPRSALPSLTARLSTADNVGPIRRPPKTEQESEAVHPKPYVGPINSPLPLQPRNPTAEHQTEHGDSRTRDTLQRREILNNHPLIAPNAAPKRDEDDTESSDEQRAADEDAGSTLRIGCPSSLASSAPVSPVMYDR